MSIRLALLSAGIKNYELAEMMGISEWTLSRRLRKELSEEEQQRIVELIRNHTIPN
jgi:DNA-binding Lrp family transcriptional regulator